VTWAKKPERLPIVLTREEVQQVLSHLSGEMLLIAQLLYGCGLRLTECLGLRVQDVKTTMIYTHVAQTGVLGVRSPLDAL
jgi:integrase